MNTEELLNSLSDNTKSLVAEDKWSDALMQAPVNEKDAIAELYLIHLCEQGNQWEKIGWDKIEPIKSILIKWIKELGIREATNPYMQFIENFYSIESNKATKLTDSNCISLNNLYADRTLDFSDIAGTGENGLNHVIFNHNLYKFGQSDLEFIVKAYESLSTKSFVAKLSVETIKNELSKEKSAFIDKQNTEKDYLNALRNSIIFVDPVNPQTSEINSQQTIESLLSAGQNTVSEKEDRELKQFDDDYNNLTIDQKRKWLSKVFPTMGKEGIENVIQNAEVKNV